MKKRKVSILGSTGSVGKNTLQIVREAPGQYEVLSLSCGSSVDLLVQQIREFHPSFVSVGSDEAVDVLKKELQHQKIESFPEIFVGDKGHQNCINSASPEVLIAAMNGTHGLMACLEAIDRGVEVLGLANKEVLVMAGDFINEKLKNSEKTQIVPVDSEHSAIFQSLMGNKRTDLNKVFLTASGGPFRKWTREQLQRVTKSDALQHPNWVMGPKITVDSASMMNKGLEYIEAIRLFDLRKDQIEILVHPESIIHSMVEFCDRSVMAQLGVSDMKIPISLALSYPNRQALQCADRLDLTKLSGLHFEDVDLEKFPCLRLALESLDMGCSGPVILNAANEEAVFQFLDEQIHFLEIPQFIEQAMEAFSDQKPACLENVIELNSEVRNWVRKQIQTRLSLDIGVS